MKNSINNGITINDTVNKCFNDSINNGFNYGINIDITKVSINVVLFATTAYNYLLNPTTT